MQNGSQPIALQSPQMQQIYQQVQQAAPTKATVLITGETGVGKEIIAQDIHRTNSRSRYPFKVVNCSAFPENGLLQSELFGHEKGAFTGATAQRAGMFEQADGGTLFLDEIGEMFFGVQAMLLRVLEHQPFTRIGGNKNVKVDVRIIAATNRDLVAAVENGTFRQDLYYRLSAFHIHIPPLRERREDVAPLADAFIAELSATYQKQVTGMTAAARHYLETAEWQGNIRQLKHVINRAILTTQTDTLDIGDMPSDIVLVSQPTGLESRQQNIQGTLPIKVRKILERLSVVEFISIFGGIPIAVWECLPAQTQENVIREAAFKLAECLGSHQDTIYIAGKDRQQILTAAAQQRFEKYGTYTQTAETLGVDRRTLKTYLENGDVRG
ncbi:MAG: sigma-54 dependent transcriptional regulator [Candidatus Poribacteria bacterium]|nr:sigma-54 dependent transcriptional regulator [Candidatus Poribacteria bacterium]